MTMEWRAYLEQGAHWQYYVDTFGDPVAYLEEFWARRYDTHRCECGGGPGTAARGVCWFRFDVDAVQRAGRRYDDSMMTVDHYVPGDPNVFEVVTQEENWRRHYLRIHLGVKEVRYGFDHSAGYGFARLEQAG